MPQRIALAAAVLSLAALTSCSNLSGPRVLSSDAARRVADSGHSGHSGRQLARQLARQPFAPAAPSARVLAAAARRPRDRHGMPVYAPGERTRLVRTTAYACHETDHLQYGVLNAAGTPLRFNQRVRSAAADWSVYPVGTVFKVRGLPCHYVVDDYGSALAGTQTVDMFMPNEAWMRAWGTRKVELTVVRWGSFTRSAELLAKRLQHPHCRQMYAAIASQHRQRTVAAR